MADETTTETTDETAAADTVVADAGTDAVETTETAQPAAVSTPGGGASGGSGGAAGVSTTPIDVDAEFAAKDTLIDKFAAGLLTTEEYAAETAKIDKKILAAQRELAKPAQQVQAQAKEQQAARAYWQNWGKGDDVANKIGKGVRGDRAAVLFQEAIAEVAANPRYQNRKEFDANSIAYDRWLDKLEAEAKKTPASKQAAPPNTRVTGDVAVSQTGQAERKLTAREKLDRGDYNIEG